MVVLNPLLTLIREHILLIETNSFGATKSLEEKTCLVCRSSSEGSSSFGRDHLRNYCLNHVAKFSCAVDCFLELCFFVFKNHLENITRNVFFDIVYQSFIQRENHGAIEIVREPVWSWLRNHCSSFSTISADAVFSDVFRMSTFGVLTR